MSDRSSKPDLPLIAELRESAKLDDLNRDRQEAIALAVFDRVAGRIRRDRAMGSWLRRAAQFVGALGTMKVAVALALSGGIVTAAARQWVHRPEAPAIAADRDATSRKASAPNAGVPQRGA
ncbi:MAG TPA: hypothetical protein VJT73_12845, partial [Polyangiaceae bacterium]|nr:hypothetical protein [Polyangiaceae bacterium]